MLSCHWKESFWEWGCEAIRNHLSVSSKNFDAQEVCLFTSYDSILPFDIWYLLFVIWNLKFIFIFEIDWSGGNQVTQQTQGVIIVHSNSMSDRGFYADFWFDGGREVYLSAEKCLF